MSHNDIRKLTAAEFIQNNGQVLRTINIMRFEYIKLSSCYSVLKQREINESAFLDCINYLAESGYIQIRDIASKHEAHISDTNYRELEAKLSAKGIRLVSGYLKDDLVEV